ncbi:MAG TPA: BTAD domain-containing putative transcriptional regulator [Nakamurella sp.]
MSVVVRVLGPLEVICHGRSVAISGRKERGLLVILALQSGRVVPSTRLIEALWDGEPPASVEVSLRVLVSRVRTALARAGADHPIVASSLGYSLTADDVDVAQFATLSTRGRKELADGRFVAASATLAQALALWRSERLAEAGTRYLQAESDRFVEVRLSVLEARIGADLACGRHADVLGELAALCAGNPLREGLWAQWIMALYRCGRQAECLRAYQNLRSALGVELGIDPSPALRRLEAMVLAQDPVLQPPEASPPTARHLLPSALDVGERVPLAGRGLELRVLATAWAAACAGRSATVLVSGDAGIGKSRLLRECARSAQSEEGIVLYGRCDPELAIACQPFVECLSEAVAASPDRVLADVGERKLAELARMVPELASRRPDLPPPARSDPDLERYLLFGAVGSLLSALARSAPVLVVLDDLHWADRLTLQLLTHLTGLRLGRIMFVGAHRHSERPDGPLVETLGTFHRIAAITRVALHGITPQQAVEVMGAIAGREPDDAAVHLAEVLHQETAGNPFYLTEMLRHLVEAGVIVELPDGRCTASAAVTSAGLPDSVREVLDARLARLGDQAAGVLAMAAVIGQEFDVELLFCTTQLDEDRLLDLLDAGVRTELVQEVDERVGRYRFAHALVQHTLYTGLSTTRRTRAHARVATAMESLGGRASGELAYHYLAGITPATVERAIHHARAAGEHALAVSAPTEAVRWYSAALNVLPPPRDDIDHARLQLELGIAQRRADDPGYRETLLSAAHIAHRRGAHDLLVDAAIEGHPGGFSSLGQVDAEKVAVLETALTVAPSDSKRAQLLAALSGELTWHPDHQRRLALADEAVSIARRTGDPDTLFEAILRPGPATWVPETSERRVDLFREAVALADRAEDPIGRIDVVSILSSALLERGLADRFDNELDAAAQIAMEFQEPLMRSMILLTRCCLTIVRGELELAEQQATQLLEIGGHSGDPEEGHNEVLGIIRWHQGRIVEALPFLRASLARLPDLSGPRAALAGAEAVTGDHDVAGTLLSEAVHSNFEMLYGPAWLGCMCQWAAVAAELGDTRAADILYRRLLPWQELFGTAGPIPIHGVSHALGRLAVLLGDIDSAERHFAVAWRMHRRMRAPFYTAETELYWGRMLMQADPDRARSLLDHALDLARRYGFGDVECRAAAALVSG